MWISNYCFSCISQHNNVKTKEKSAKYFIIRFSPNGPPDIFEEMKDIEFLIQSFVDIVKKQFQSKDVVLNLYVFQIICQMLEDKSLNANISLIVRKNYMQKGKKESYAQMEPAMKKKVLSDKAIWCKSLDPVEKEKLLSHRAEWYKSPDPKEKEKLCPNQQIGINHLVLEKKIFCLAEQFGINHWILHKTKESIMV